MSVKNVSKFLIEVSRRRVSALSILLILTVLVLFSPTPCKAAKFSEKYQIASNIELAAPLPSQMKVEDVKIQNVVNESYIYVNEEDSPAPVNINQGKLVWGIGNLTLQSASLNDSWGEPFPVLNVSNYLMNPPLNGTVPPHSTYTLSLIMVFVPGALYVDSFQAWEFSTTFSSNLTIQATITLPSNFSTPFYTAGANYTKNQDYKVLTWQNQPPQTPNETISVVFLPFPYNPQTIFLNFSTDISSVFPIWGGGTDSVTQEFTSLSEYNGLVVPPIFEIPVLFPPTSDNNTQVTSVYDSEGPCTKLPERLSEVNYTNSGKYYPDKVSQVVYVYPRAMPTENLYDYFVTVTFDTGNLLPFNATLKDKLQPPYDSIIRFTINLKGSGDWKLNLTQGTIVQFWLPQGTQPYESPDYKTYYDSAKGRWSVTFANASAEWTTGIWEIDFYVVRLYDFFWTGIVSIVLLLAVAFVMYALRKRPRKHPLKSLARKTIAYVLPLFTGFGFVGAELVIANDWIWAIFTQKIVLAAILVTQVVLTLLVIFLALKWKFVKAN